MNLPSVTTVKGAQLFAYNGSKILANTTPWTYSSAHKPNNLTLFLSSGVDTLSNGSLLDFSALTSLDAGFDEDDQIQWKLQGNSRLGATVKAENISGRFEFGINESDVTSRRIYGEWDFGAAKLKVGKDYSPVKQFISGQVFDGDAGLLGNGTAYGGRNGQIALSFGGFEVAAVTNQGGMLRNMDTGDVHRDTEKGRIDARRDAA